MERGCKDRQQLKGTMLHSFAPQLHLEIVVAKLNEK